MSTAPPDRPASVVDGAWAALGFLTIVPVPEERAGRGHPHATAFFPWVGMGLGLIAVAARSIPLDPVVAAAIAVTALFLATGGLHWDGWADLLDATVTPGVTRERRREILADPRAGAHAVFGVAVLVLVAVFAAARAPAWGIVLGCVLGRWTMVATLRWAPPLTTGGTGARLRTDAEPLAASVAPLALLVLLFLGGVGANMLLVSASAGLSVGALLASATVRRLGGMNGDAHGAAGLLAEVAVWVAAAGSGPAPP